MELCKLAGVSRSGYYRWIAASNQRAIREASDYQDFLLIKEAYDYRGYAKGSRGICMRLKRMGITMNRKKVQRLMRKYNLCCPIRKANPYMYVPFYCHNASGKFEQLTDIHTCLIDRQRILCLLDLHHELFEQLESLQLQVLINNIW